MTTLNKPSAASNVNLTYLQHSQGPSLAIPSVNKIHGTASSILPDLQDRTENPGFRSDEPGYCQPLKRPERKPLDKSKTPSSGFLSNIICSVKNFAGIQSAAYKEQERVDDPTKSDCDFGFSSASSGILTNHVIPGSGKSRFSTGQHVSSSNLALSPFFDLHLGPEAQAETMIREQLKKKEEQLS